jgi:hypothetical protein
MERAAPSPARCRSTLLRVAFHAPYKPQAAWIVSIGSLLMVVEVLLFLPDFPAGKIWKEKQ